MYYRLAVITSVCVAAISGGAIEREVDFPLHSYTHPPKKSRQLLVALHAKNKEKS